MSNVVPNKYNKLKRKSKTPFNFLVSQEGTKFFFEFAPGGNSQLIVFPPGGKEELSEDTMASSGQPGPSGSGVDSADESYGQFASQLPGKQEV
jgi:hypothetical protein